MDIVLSYGLSRVRLRRVVATGNCSDRAKRQSVEIIALFALLVSDENCHREKFM